MRSSRVTPLEGPLVLVSHDAGAANLALSWAESLQKSHALACRAVLQGPAAALVKGLQLDLQLFEDTAEALTGARVLLSGTGWASQLEHEARALARAKGIRSIAALDHWVNYHERFMRNGQTVLPDAIWVADTEALVLARAAFPGIEIVQQPNLYLERQLRGIESLPNTLEVLYLLEPARSNWGRNTPGEFQALDYFMTHRERAGMATDAPVRLRPHPCDPPGKYERWLQHHRGLAMLATPAPLAEDMSRASWVAGCETAALAIALAAGRRTVCTLPPWAPQCRLPHQGLIHLRQLVPPTT